MVTIVKKRTQKFKRHHSDRYKRVGESWRKPRGIDSAVRRRFRSRTPMCSIGYGSNKKTRHMMPNGLRRFVVSNPRDVDMLLMHNNTFAAEIASNVSSKKRIAILEKAKVLGVKVTNAEARVRAVEA
ncbi:putative 60S ribosomal protein L32 [Jaminaea rosea]|uniref:Putative 60S ribosomal protein L32 n=1 Tax=Jaminaea rosea TaxID=1569628 RepID=A0A316UYE5_9BASI|nr:putative 60S ribosomal protein L32 [Jaminaea rosea]PWN28165.1 putative 60S ribosomal protein L32 [Jaminaea rosea]